MARPREFDDDQVLAAARDQFWATGYVGTSIDAIAAATGLGKGSLYGAFGDKHQLFLRVFEAYCADAIASARADLAGDDASAYARLAAHVRAIAAATAADTDHRGCLLAKGTAELAGQYPDVAGLAWKAFDAIEGLLAADIRGAQRHGDLDAAADPDALAGMVLAVLRGIEALGKAGTAPVALEGIAEMALRVLPRPCGLSGDGVSSGTECS